VSYRIVKCCASRIDLILHIKYNWRDYLVYFEVIMAQRGLFARGRDTVRVEVELKQPAIPEKKSLGQIRIEFATGYSTQYDLKEGDTYLDLKQHCLNLLVDEVRWSCLDETKNGGARIVFISDEQEDNVPIRLKCTRRCLILVTAGYVVFLWSKKNIKKLFLRMGILFSSRYEIAIWKSLERAIIVNAALCNVMSEA
jgi:hypothetical protein